VLRNHHWSALKPASCAVMLLAFGTDGASAQRGTTIDQIVLGQLIDDATRAPISNGTIRLLRADSSVALSVVTDSAGRFRIATRTPGTYRLRGEHVAYQSAVSPPLQFVLRDTLRLDFHLLPQATLLSPIIVRAERTAAPYYSARGMGDFYRRMMSPNAQSGQYLTRDSIANWEGSTTIAMLTQLRGVYVDARDARSLQMRNCTPRIYVDGIEYQLMGGEKIDDAFPPHVLEAVEVYVGQSVPAEFFGRNCGVIAFWRRR
jgi:hypothetical protein